jgi:hypothetical protein
MCGVGGGGGGKPHSTPKAKVHVCGVGWGGRGAKGGQRLGSPYPTSHPQLKGQRGPRGASLATPLPNAEAEEEERLNPTSGQTPRTTPILTGQGWFGRFYLHKICLEVVGLGLV